MKKKLIAPGTEEFNYKTLDGKQLDLKDLSEAVDQLPVFAERTLIVVTDYDIFKSAEEQRQTLLNLLRDLPDYVCLVFVYDILSFSADRRVKLNAAILDSVTAVEFCPQEQNTLIGWIARQFRDAGGKKIRKDDAEYLLFITGGLMTQMSTEIEKVAAHSRGEAVTRADIDAVVIPVLDAVSYQLTDAITAGRFDAAAQILGDLLRQQEAPHKILYSISLKLRQLLTAKLCLESGQSTAKLMEICSISREFQARNLLYGARRVSVDWCREAVRIAYEAAKRLNLGDDGGEILPQMLAELAMVGTVK